VSRTKDLPNQPPKKNMDIWVIRLSFLLCFFSFIRKEECLVP